MKKPASLMCLICVAMAVVALPALSETKKNPLAVSFASDTLIVPVMVNSNGYYGAVFGTYVALMNPTSKSFPVTVTLYDSAGASTKATITLGAGELKTYQNFLDAVFNHFYGAGAVKFESGVSVGGTSDNLFILSAEVYTSTSGNRFGTSLPAFDFPGSDSRSFAPGVSVDANNRANVGCFNQSGSANTVKVTVRDGSGNQVSTFSLQLPAHAWGQTPVAASVTGGYVQFDPSGAASCYVVVVNNLNNDGRLVAAVEYTP